MTVDTEERRGGRGRRRQIFQRTAPIQGRVSEDFRNRLEQESAELGISTSFLVSVSVQRGLSQASKDIRAGLESGIL